MRRKHLCTGQMGGGGCWTFISPSHGCLREREAEGGKRADEAESVPYPLRDIQAMGGEGSKCRGAGDGCRAGQPRACMQGPTCLVSDPPPIRK